MRRIFQLPLLALLLSGCPLFVVDRGEIMVPVRTLEPPAVSALPNADTYVTRLAAWRRDTRIGIGGYIEATPIEPGIAAAQVAHEAALQSMGQAATADLLSSRWPVLYGTLSDRFPIDIDWRFDEQFISNRRILDPANWTFTLTTSQGSRYEPLATTALRALPVPQNGAWVGRVRLWFPWLDPERRTALVAGGTSWMQLQLRHPSGIGEVTWRFRPD